jgi:hypothetical protein
VHSNEQAAQGMTRQPNKRMQLTKLRAAPVLQAGGAALCPRRPDGRGHRFAADPGC